MQVKSKVNFVGYVGVSPLGSLEETAVVIGKLLGLNFEEDKSGYYQEFPAFCAEVLGMKLALLGIPDEDMSLSDEPIDYFELQLSTLSKSGLEGKTDLSEYLVDILSGDASVKCWVLD